MRRPGLMGFTAVSTSALIAACGGGDAADVGRGQAPTSAAPANPATTVAAVGTVGVSYPGRTATLLGAAPADAWSTTCGPAWTSWPPRHPGPSWGSSASASAPRSVWSLIHCGEPRLAAAAESALEKAGLPHQNRTFPGVDHAFSNPTGPRHDATQAAAYQAVLDWFGRHLR